MKKLSYEKKEYDQKSYIEAMKLFWIDLLKVLNKLTSNTQKFDGFIKTNNLYGFKETLKEILFQLPTN